MLPDESFVISDAEQVKLLRDELGLGEFPGSIPEEGGIFFRGVSSDPTHWIVLIYITTSRDVDADDWRAYGFPKSKFSRENAEWIVAEATSSYGAAGPFFSR